MVSGGVQSGGILQLKKTRNHTLREEGPYNDVVKMLGSRQCCLIVQTSLQVPEVLSLPLAALNFISMFFHSGRWRWSCDYLKENGLILFVFFVILNDFMALSARVWLTLFIHLQSYPCCKRYTME